MLQVPPRASSTDFTSRRQIALERIQQLIAHYELLARRAFRNYYGLQGLTIGLAAITPCLIALAKDNPRNEVLNWLQLFFPALAALAAGLVHVFKFREDGVRYRTLVEGLRSQLWRYQTRTGDLTIALTEDQALDRLVQNVDGLNLQSVATWGADQLAGDQPEKPKPTDAPKTAAPAQP
jgi:hypothetical protein